MSATSDINKVSIKYEGFQPGKADFAKLPYEIVLAIFKKLGPMDQVAAMITCKSWKNVGEDKSLKSVRDFCLGKREWKKHFKKVEGIEKPLPPNINKILSAPTPFKVEGYSGKVRDTHILVWIPEVVDGVTISLNGLNTLFKYGYYKDYVKNELGGQKLGKATWVLISKNILEGSRDKTYDEQKKIMSAYVSQGYSLPKALEVTAALLIHEKETKKRLLNNDPWTYTRCQAWVTINREPVAIGGFAAGGLTVTSSRWAYQPHGVVGVRKIWQQLEKRIKQKEIFMSAIGNNPNKQKPTHQELKEIVLSSDFLLEVAKDKDSLTAEQRQQLTITMLWKKSEYLLQEVGDLKKENEKKDRKIAVLEKGMVQANLRYERCLKLVNSFAGQQAELEKRIKKLDSGERARKKQKTCNNNNN
ncbi:F-box protein [Candidatus Neptunochlamydia vexilliferae]|uniref:F-box domain-containing protein n=1 Tax=Candidatus Neptunichlamydia vexilliferae TaxID=1651774 RepID=A0ABS0AZJ7_9BACT|nr:F-box protein [Candidatus Neptunochlamydia vexilliferae]MBF5059370.1 hypothetical protein [Candidatus Neptunochlamydia vexilliferae]